MHFISAEVSSLDNMTKGHSMQKLYVFIYHFLVCNELR